MSDGKTEPQTADKERRRDWDPLEYLQLESVFRENEEDWGKLLDPLTVADGKFTLE